MTEFPRALRLLDAVQHLAQLESFDASSFLAAVGEALNAPGGATLVDLSNQLDGLRGLLDHIDRFTQKAMRIRLTGSIEALPQPLHTLLHATVVSYQRDLSLLRARIAPALMRHHPATAVDTTDRVLQAAEEVLAVRATLRQGVLALAQRVAADWLPGAQRAARDRSQPDDQLERWRRARVDLEHIAARGDQLDAGSFAERLDRITAPEDPPEEERPDRFSLLELD